MSTNPPQHPHFPLPADWHAKATVKLNSIIPQPGNCIACGPPGMNKVYVGQHVVSAVTLQPNGNFDFTGFTYPQVFLICSNCGFTRYFNYNVLMENMVTV